MNPTTVVIAAEFQQLALQIERIPEEQAIEKLAANGIDQPFHKRMRHRHMGNCLDFLDFEDAQIGQPGGPV